MRNTGFRENFSYWSAHQGTITYNDADRKFYYYASGAEASWEEAQGYLFRGSKVYYYKQGQEAVDFYKTTPIYLNGRGKAETTLKRQLANIDASGKNKISKSNWAISALGLITLDVTTPDPSDVVWQKWVVEGVVATVASIYIHANSKNSPKPNIVYEIYVLNVDGFQTMKYGVSSRSDFVTRSGNPRPEYQCVALNLVAPTGTFYWYSILARTTDRATALSIEKSLVESYISIHGRRPLLQFRP